jgi:hypothetical protein
LIVKVISGAVKEGSLKRPIDKDLTKQSSAWPAPQSDDARRYYRLTPLGRCVLDAECDRLQELVRSFR